MEVIYSLIEKLNSSSQSLVSEATELIANYAQNYFTDFLLNLCSASLSTELTPNQVQVAQTLLRNLISSAYQYNHNWTELQADQRSAIILAFQSQMEKVQDRSEIKRLSDILAG